MKIVKLCLLLIVCLYQKFFLLSQELQVTSIVKQPADLSLVQFAHLDDSFNFLQSQNILDQSFQDFVLENLSLDSTDNQNPNDTLTTIVQQAHGLVSDTLKNRFFSAINCIIDSDENLDQIEDPIFIYVMSHKDDFMKPMMRTWVEEWEKTLDQDGFPLLNWCLNHVEIAKLLVDLKADINMQDKSGWAPLHYAAFKNCPKNVQMYLDAGADINIQNDMKSTPLHIAAWQNHINIVGMLIAQGADLNRKDLHGNTPLYVTEYRGIINMLIAAGAKLDHQDLMEDSTTSNYRKFAYHAIQNARESQNNQVDKKKQIALTAKIRQLFPDKNCHCVVS